MKFKEIVNRLTGISTPVFGVSWNPPEASITVARRVVSFLEDRRVLYNPYQLEDPRHCIQSVIEIRHFLTEELGSSDPDNELSNSLRAMRAASRKFLDTVNPGQGKSHYVGYQSHFDDWVFNSALGELRGVFGVHIAQIAAQHGLDVEDDLASILPGQDEAAES